jgi:hypothetical protein
LQFSPGQLIEKAAPWTRPIDGSPEVGIQEVFRRLATDAARTEAISEEVQRAPSR